MALSPQILLGATPDHFRGDRRPTTELQRARDNWCALAVADASVHELR